MKNNQNLYFKKRRKSRDILEKSNNQITSNAISLDIDISISYYLENITKSFKCEDLKKIRKILKNLEKIGKNPEKIRKPDKKSRQKTGNIFHIETQMIYARILKNIRDTEKNGEKRYQKQKNKKKVLRHEVKKSL